MPTEYLWNLKTTYTLSISLYGWWHVWTNFVTGYNDTVLLNDRKTGQFASSGFLFSCFTTISYSAREKKVSGNSVIYFLKILYNLY